MSLSIIVYSMVVSDGQDWD